MSSLRAVALSVVFTAPVLAQNRAPVARETACPEGLAAVDRQGHCCLPGQRWQGAQCEGAPTSCPPGQTLHTSRNRCVARACDEGEVRAGDGQHCCYAGQRWSADDGRCTGDATCPDGTTRAGAACVASARVREDVARTIPAAMVRVPGGVFRVGEHAVSLGPYALDRVEVTAGAYRACVAAGACEGAVDLPRDASAPAVNVTYEMARRYCAWAGGRLPTEAEWEFAARGAGARTYPWGERAPDCDVARVAGCGERWTPATARRGGASPFGALDLAGSVAEWVADRFGERRGEGTVRDPTGPARGDARVVRGGSFVSTARDVTTRARRAVAPAEARFDVGFRCARGL